MQIKTLAWLAVLAAAIAPGLAGRPGLGHPGSATAINNFRDKIKHVVLMVMENRSVDNLLGGQRLPGLSNPIQEGPFCNPIDVTDPSSPRICTQPRDFDSIVHDPDHSAIGNNQQFFGTHTPDNAAIDSGVLKPDMQGFITEHVRIHGDSADVVTLGKEVMNYYTEEQVPVITELCRNFAVFNYWFSDVASATDPNRLFITSGTSLGKGDNDFGAGSMPQRSIFQELSERQIPWKAYTQDNSMGEVFWYRWLWEHNKTDLIVDKSHFVSDIAADRLPPFSYIVPSCCGAGTNSMHPNGLVSDGERFIKEIYDALRASRYWADTLLIVTFDESGGFHDHVAPPLAPRPDNLTYETTAPDGTNYTYDFGRLGGRIPTILVSPWVPAMVEQLGRNSDGERVAYRATSLLRTLGHLWGFRPYNERVRTAPSFEHLITKRFRPDTPGSLPDATPFNSLLGRPKGGALVDNGRHHGQYSWHA